MEKEMEKEMKKKIYKGKITSLRQVDLDAAGHRTYEIWFTHTHKCYFEINSKTDSLIENNCIIEFEGEFVGKHYWIRKIHSIKQLRNNKGERYDVNLKYLEYGT